MKTNLELDQAILKVFGNKLKRVFHPSSEWMSFVTYRAQGSGDTYFFKLLEVPATFHISQEIYLKKKQRLGQIIHQVKFFFVQRSFQSVYYIVQADTNFTSVTSMVRLANLANQSIQKEIVYQFLECVNKLESVKDHSTLSFSLDQIGKNSQGKFLLANYELYFQNRQKADCLRENLKNALFSLITLEQNYKKFNVMQIYSTAEQRYDKNIISLVKKFIEHQWSYSQVFTLLSSRQEHQQDTQNNTTLTESFIEDLDNLDLSDVANNQFSVQDSIYESFRKVKIKQKQNRNKRLLLLFIVFVLILLSAGAITYKFLGKKTLTCGQSEYADLDLNRCFSCDSSCQRCNDGSNNQCLSCKNGLYLVVNSQYESNPVGVCQLGCTGKIIKNRQCINPPNNDQLPRD